MTFSKLTWHKRTHGHYFTGSEFRVLMSIFDHSSADGTNSHPGIKRMMTETRYGKAAVSTAVTSLKTRGWIRETRRGSGISGNASVFELVPDAPQPPSSSPVREQPTRASSSPGVEQTSEVVRLERTSSSPEANQVVRLEQSPSDPGLSDPGSDPDSSDQEEVRYVPNHLEDQGETAPFGRSLSVEGRTEAPEEGADGRSPKRSTLNEPCFGTSPQPATAAEGSPEERLLAAIRSEGSVGSKSDLPRLMGVDRQAVNVIIPRLIAEGVLIHDTERDYPALVLA